MTSTSNKHTEWILETIDHLRRRKARPDLARICHVVRRRFGLSPTDTEAKLEKLVDAEVVIKVDYKGNVSYRNAAKWRKSMLGCGVLNSTSISTKILEAILEISKATDSYVAAHAKKETESNNNNNNNGCNNNNRSSNDIQGTVEDANAQNSPKVVRSAAEVGVPLESINVWLKMNCEGFSSLRSPLTVILKREIDAGRVRRLANGNYVITQPQIAAISSGVIRPLKSVKKAASESACPGGSSSINSGSSSSSGPSGPVGASSGVTPASGGGGSSSLKVAASLGVSVSHSQRPSAAGHGTMPARRGRPPKHRPGIAAGAAPSSCVGGAAAASASTQGSSSLDSNSSLSQAAPAEASSKLKRMLTSEVPTSTPGGLLTATDVAGSASCPVGAPGLTNHGQLAGQGPERKMARRGPPQSHGQVLCDFCKLSSLANTKGEPEALLQCKDCTAKAHPSCMKYSRLLASRACRAPWQCMDCKTCFMCQDSGDPDQMLFCDGCDRGFHMNCHRPTVSKKPSGTWVCSDCRLEDIALQRSEFTASSRAQQMFMHDSAPPTPAESPVQATHMPVDIPLSTSPVYVGEGNYPDASRWSVDDVAEFFSSAGFAQQAQLFKEQEIDGVSLLLLKRSDILKGLDMKLGPALKVNRLVQGLQTARQGSV